MVRDLGYVGDEGPTVRGNPPKCDSRERFRSQRYAYQRVLDKKEKHVDHEVLSYLVDTVVDEVQANPGEASKL